MRYILTSPKQFTTQNAARWKLELFWLFITGQRHIDTTAGSLPVRHLDLHYLCHQSWRLVLVNVQVALRHSRHSWCAGRHGTGSAAQRRGKSPHGHFVLICQQTICQISANLSTIQRRKLSTRRTKSREKGDSRSLVLTFLLVLLQFLCLALNRLMMRGQ